MSFFRYVNVLFYPPTCVPRFCLECPSRYVSCGAINAECISSLNAPPESVLEETDFYTHSTLRNPLIEGQTWGDSSIIPPISKPRKRTVIVKQR
jgi:hypothetical protein